ncbi:MAG: single-stranded-DNA-specific exonuclease RecJ [Cellvibrionaceae bacterium]
MKKYIRRRNSAAAFSCSKNSPLLNRIYANRGIESEEQLARTLQSLHTPKQLKGLDDAIPLLVEAVKQQQKILVVGDFDADGATSSSVAVLALSAMGHQNVDFLVPNRFDYGYGLTPEIVEVAKDYHPDIIVTVDNGIASIEGVRLAKQLGMTVIVTDHHLPGDETPEADAIVNPNQRGCEFPSKNLAGVGVIFYVMSALRSALRDAKWFEDNTLTEPNMAEFLDIVALGTVADVVPLDTNNRILVHQGLQRMRSGKMRPGIQALLEVAGKDYRSLTASDLGFALGPRLNAAGRLDDMRLGIQCLTCSDYSQARTIAQDLDDLNRDRKSIEAGMQQKALKNLEQLTLAAEDEMPWGLTLYDPEWHQGVIGILASRIKDKFHRPVIAFANANDDGSEIKGSARSIPGLHIRDALDAVAKRYPKLLSKFGGHAMAAGLSIASGNYAAFQQAFDEEVRRQLTASDLEAEILTDGELSQAEFHLGVAEELQSGGPWGQHFPEPVFDGEFQLVEQRIVGEKHLKMKLSPRFSSDMDAGASPVVDAIAFNVDTKKWPDFSVSTVILAYKLDINEFRGRRSLQLLVDYIEPVEMLT